MTYFYPGPPRTRSAWLPVLAAGLIGILLGGLIMFTFVPGMVADRVMDQVQARLPSGSPLGAEAQPLPEPPASSAAVAVADRVGPAVVGILAESLAGYDWFNRPLFETKGGSGVIISAEGHIVTNNHVIEGAKNNQVKVFLADGRKLTGKIAGADPATDLAVVKIDADNLPVAAFGDSDRVRVGETAIAIGNPVSLDFQRTVTVGVVSGLNRTLRVGEETIGLIQTDAAINPGNSGGPLTNARGEIIGINTIKLATERVESMGFAIPSNVVKPIVQELIARGQVIRPYLGVHVADKEQAARLDVRIERGLLVVDIVDGGPADRAGIRPGDVILSVDGRKTDNTRELHDVLRAQKVGERVTVEVSRDGRALKITVILGERPAD